MWTPTRQPSDQERQLNAANRLLQVDPNNLKAILYSVLVKKAQCGKTSDAATCDDAAALAQKGLQVTKPAATSDADWQKLTARGLSRSSTPPSLSMTLSQEGLQGRPGRVHWPS